jgi:hypothetical protein
MRAPTPRIYSAHPAQWDPVDRQAAERKRDSDLDREKGWWVAKAVRSIAERQHEAHQRGTSSPLRLIEGALQVTAEGR